MLNTDVSNADLQWRTGARNTGSGNDCVEVAPATHSIAVRDSKDPQGPRLAFTRAELSTFFNAIRQGNYDS
jgi:hypothetical protein